jgi:hypothetical protein
LRSRSTIIRFSARSFSSPGQVRLVDVAGRDQRLHAVERRGVVARRDRWPERCGRRRGRIAEQRRDGIGRDQLDPWKQREP